MLEKGLKGRQEMTVAAQDTAKALGSGELNVFATPALIALIEKTAWQSIASELPEGTGSVGTKLAISHLSATPVGMKVWCETELIEIDRRRLVFQAEVFDEAGKIGEGTHERFLVQNQSFFQKAQEKKK